MDKEKIRAGQPPKKYQRKTAFDSTHEKLSFLQELIDEVWCTDNISHSLALSLLESNRIIVLPMKCSNALLAELEMHCYEQIVENL